jgi:single-strand DNA-binding protein
MNSVYLIGRLTKDVELRKNESGSVRGDFTLAVNRIGAKENQQQADFINCRVWNNQAENLAHYMGKGSQIGLEGILRNDKCKDKDGNNKYIWYVLAQNITYLSEYKGGKQEKEEEVITGSIKSDDLFLDDSDLPF